MESKEEVVVEGAFPDENVGDATPNERGTEIALPVTVASLIEQRKSKTKRTLNDLVDDIHLQLYEDADYRRYIDAVMNSQAAEGSLICDDIAASYMIRDKARELGSKYVASQNTATLRTALQVVLRRYGISRKERRES